MENNKDVYFVAVKVFLENKDGAILITKDRFGDWDIPGGRLRENDFLTPLEDVVNRKIKEELGDEVKYELNEPVVFIRHERDEILDSGDREKRRIFAVGYRASYTGGDIELGKNHEDLLWLKRSDAAEEYLEGGWLKGVRDYWRKTKSEQVEGSIKNVMVRNMAEINKTALLIMNDEQTKFLVTRKDDATVPHWLLPGGGIEEDETIEESVVREIKEELDCDVDQDSLEFVGEYEAPAAGRPGQFVNIKLYKGTFTGDPKASSEIVELGWLSKDDVTNSIASEIIREKLIPDLVDRGILK